MTKTVTPPPQTKNPIATEACRRSSADLAFATLGSEVCENRAPPPQDHVMLWQDISSAPKDKTHIIIAVPTRDRDGYIVGEAYFDKYEDGGDWWWAGTSYDVYHDAPISEVNHHPPRFWQPMPSPPSLIPTKGSDND